MTINVAGTNALGDYLVSEIANVRTLMGLVPQTSSLPPATPAAAAPTTPAAASLVTPAAASAATPAAASSATPAAASSATPAAAKTDFRALALTQVLANTEALFGIQTATDSNAGSLPVLSTQTPQQVAYAAIQTSQIDLQFSNIATLFGPGGLGSTTNTRA